MLLGVDTGGTFTDFVYYDGNSIRTHKTPSTPAAPEQAILRGIKDFGLSLQGLRVIHGSTVATNAVLEGKGAKTIYITNYGLKDVLTIGRQARQELYELQPKPLPPPVADEYLLETGGRISSQGEVIEDLTEAELVSVCQQVLALQPQSVAINLLFSFLDNRFETQIKGRLPKQLFVSCSSEILPEHKEYERGITTWLNAYVGPLVQGYLTRLAGQLQPATLAVMRSSGDTCLSGQAGQEAVHLMLSGPAGGLAGANFIAADSDAKRIMTLDMGGTSTDVALMDGEVGLTNQGRIGRFPVAVPMVDMHTIGAGGGSIAYMDQAGGLQVGPESAGADPGPVCYGNGGTHPTVTDANLILGRLPRSARLAGEIKLDFDAARQSLYSLAFGLGLESAEQAADGIVRVANEHMVQALRVISVQKGIDPRNYTLVAFGGAGGMHVCELADTLDIRKVLAPAHAGVLSALGMLVAPAGRQLSHALVSLLDACDDGIINDAISDLVNKGRTALRTEGHDVNKAQEKASLDMRYRGQAYTLNVPWHGIQQAEMDFHRLHEQRFGHRLHTAMELVNVRVSIRIPPLAPVLTKQSVAGQHNPEFGQVYGCQKPVAIYRRNQLVVDQVLQGPFIVCDPVSTTYIAPGWQCCRDQNDNLDVKRL